MLQVFLSNEKCQDDETSALKILLEKANIFDSRRTYSACLIDFFVSFLSIFIFFEDKNLN